MKDKSAGRTAAAVILGILCVLSIGMFVFLKFGAKAPALAHTGGRGEAGKEDGAAEAAREEDASASYEDFVVEMDGFTVGIGTQMKREEQKEAEGEEAEDYLCAFSASRRMNEGDVEELMYGDYDNLPQDRDIIQMVVNEMYARHGYQFNNEEIQAYFEKRQWYRDIDHRKTDMDEIYQNMTDVEKANIDLLTDFREG